MERAKINIAIVSFECPPANDREISFPNKQRYCDKHGYDFISYTDSVQKDLHPAWSKVPYVSKHLSDYDWVVWMDSDTYLINANTKLESFIDESKNFIIQTKLSGSICCGAFFIKNSKWSVDLLSRWWSTRFDTECLDPNNKIWEELGLKKIVGNQGEKDLDNIKVLTGGLQSNPEDTNENTFLMHSRRGHRDISSKCHLIF